MPGISVLNRNNYAQDLQLSIRGFGARSTFGIRGVKVLVDGIPATMPDGQGQVSNVALTSAGRIEVLRGPLAQLYGNAAGGVVQVFTEDDALVPTATVSAMLGRDDLWKIGAKFSTSTPGYGLTIDASEFRTDGFRPLSKAERRQLNARWQSQLTGDTHLSVVLNVLDQPVSQDPLGLNATQFRSRNPGTNSFYQAALAQRPRKDVSQQQLGTVIEHRLNEQTDLSGPPLHRITQAEQRAVDPDRRAELPHLQRRHRGLRPNLWRRRAAGGASRAARRGPATQDDRRHRGGGDGRRPPGLHQHPGANEVPASATRRTPCAARTCSRRPPSTSRRNGR